MKLCDICDLKQATRFENIVEGGEVVSFGFCEDCYRRAIALGKSPRELVLQKSRERLSRCPACGYELEDYDREFMFGCPDCYRYLAPVANREIARLNSYARPERVAYDISPADRAIARDYVVSSRVRLARNIEGLPFPHYLAELSEQGELTDGERENLRLLIRGAMLAAEGVFDGTLFEMSELSGVKRDLLVQSHTISVPLAKSELGAVIIEKGERPEISIMLMEEDHVRAQCVRLGFDIAGAYNRLSRYSIGLERELPIARSERWGYLTACPTNVGTGMRASAMTFLPALQSLGKLDGVLSALKRRFDITVRGYYGEGSDAAYGMYQVSNGHMGAISEAESVRAVESAVWELCMAESSATSELVDVGQYALTDRLMRSYDDIMRASELEEGQMCRLLADMRLGVRLGMFDMDVKRIDNALDQGLTAFVVMGDDSSKSMRSYLRARIVKECLGAK